MNKIEESTKKIIIDFKSIENSNFDIPSKYNYAFIPSSSFGFIEYDFESIEGNKKTVDFTKIEMNRFYMRLL